MTAIKTLNNNNNPNVLIVGDITDEVLLIQQIIAPDVGACNKTIDARAAKKLFINHQPLLIILAYQQIDDALTFLTTLQDDNNQENIPLVQTLLCCKAEQAEQAFSLCTHDTIKDYVVYKPLYDPFALRMKVIKGLEQHIKANQAQGLTSRITDIDNGLRKLHQLVTSDLKKEATNQQKSVQHFVYFTRKLSTQLNRFDEHFQPDNNPLNLTTSQCHSLAELLSEIHHTDFQHKSDIIENNMLRSVQWLNTFTDNFDKCIADIKQQPPTKNAHIIIVDDDEMYGSMVIDILMQPNIEVTLIDDANKALAVISKTHPDLILLDHNMPGITGLELLKQLKQLPKINTIPVIMLTGELNKEIVKQCIKAGAEGYLVKPSNRELIRAKIKEVLKSYRGKSSEH